MIERKVMLLGSTTMIDDEHLNILYYNLPSIYLFKYLENVETFTVLPTLESKILITTNKLPGSRHL